MRNLVWQLTFPPAGRRFWTAMGFVIIAALAIGILPWQVSLALTLGTAIPFLTTIRPVWGLYLLILAIPLGSILQFSLGVVGLGVAEALAIWLVLLWLVEMAIKRRLLLPQAPLLFPLALLLLFIALSISGTISLQYSLKGFLLWLEFAAIYLWVVAKVEAKDLKTLIYVTLIAASVQALLGGYQFFTATGPPSFHILGQFSRAYGTFDQPNPYGGYLAMIIPLALGLGLAPGSKLANDIPARVITVVAFGLLLATLLFSWSRGAWLAGVMALLATALLGIGSNAFEPRLLAVFGGLVTFALSVILLVSQNVPILLALPGGAIICWGGGALIYLSLRRGWILPVVLMLVFLFLLFWALGFGGLVPEEAVARLGDFPTLDMGDVRFIAVNDENFAVLERLAHWQTALAMLSHSPWLGIGIGNYVPVYPQYALPGWDDPLGHAHNYYLNIAAEAGILGLLAYLFFWSVAFAQALRLLFRVSPPKRGIVLGILGMMVALSVHNLVDNLYVQGMNLQVAAFLGVLAVLDGERAATTSSSG